MAKVGKVLVISYYFSQDEFIGSIRLQGLAKFLPEFNWNPTILTVRSPFRSDFNIKVIETEYDGDVIIKWKKRFGFKIDKPVKEQLGLPTYKGKKTASDLFLGLMDEVLTYPDAFRNWHKSAINAASILLENERFDAIISSSYPVTSHLIAREIKERYDIPWIADLRDLWTQHHNYPHSSFRKYIERKLEKKILADANALITVSQPLGQKLQELHEGKKVFVIIIGFDPSILAVESNFSDKFNIVYTGYIYKDKQDPEPFFKALHKMIQNGSVDPDDIKVEFFGNIQDWLKWDIERYNLQNIVTINGLIPRKEVLKKQKNAQVLLTLVWNDPKEIGLYSGKIFEYIAAKRPILAIGSNGGVVEEVLRDINAGAFASSTEEIEDIIKKFYGEFKQKGKVDYNGKISALDKYSQKEMARKFSIVLDNISNLNAIPMNIIAN